MAAESTISAGTLNVGFYVFDVEGSGYKFPRPTKVCIKLGLALEFEDCGDANKVSAWCQVLGLWPRGPKVGWLVVELISYWFKYRFYNLNQTGNHK